MGLLLALALLCSPARAAVAEPVAAVEFSTAGRSLGLQEAFELALGRSEELAQKGRSVEEAWARVRELWAAVQPSLSFKTSEFVQDSSSSRDKPEVKFSLSQPLFSGLKEFIAVRMGKARGRAAELELSRAKDLLYLDVAAAHLSLFGSHRELEIRAALVKITRDRIHELKERERIGRSRTSEVLAAESQLALLAAEFEQAKRSELDGQERLRFLTGLSERLVPAAVYLEDARGLDALLAASRGRSDVEARRLELAFARDDTETARRGRWPSSTLDANYYVERPESSRGIMWDLALSAELPLYRGMKTAAQVRQGLAREKKAEEALSLSLRKADLEVRTAFGDLAAGRSVVAALDRAVALAEANARAQAEDYRLGLVTNLDVLGSLNSLQQARLRLESARTDVVLSQARLAAAAGGVAR